LTYLLEVNLPRVGHPDFNILNEVTNGCTR